MGYACILDETSLCCGCGACVEGTDVRCPLCGHAVREALYKNGNEIVGCDRCVRIVYAEDIELPPSPGFWDGETYGDEER